MPATSNAADAWYVRLPDGRVFWAESTDVVRKHLTSGRVPLDSRVRRSPDDEWAGLDWTSEFVDLVAQQPVNGAPPPLQSAGEPGPRSSSSQRKATGVAARLDASRLHMPGMRRLARELVGALDNALVANKLLTAAVIGLLVGAVLTAASQEVFAVLGSGAPVVVAVLLAVVLGVGHALLGRMTYHEVSQLRPARVGECLRGLVSPAYRLTVGYLLVGGLVVWGVHGLRRLPTWLLEGEMLSPDAALTTAALAAVFGRVAELLLWPLLVLGLQLVPVAVVEEGGLFAGLRRWVNLVRQHPARLALYESLAFSVAALVVLPSAALVWLTGAAASDERTATAVASSTAALAGLVAAPAHAFLVVANVFAYLVLQYDRRST